MATVIDFGKSEQITKAKLTKPKVSIADAAKKYSTSHIRFIRRGERQSAASDVYSLGGVKLKSFEG